MAVDEDQDVDLQAVRLRLRQGAYRKAKRAGRIELQRALGRSHTQARKRMDVSVEIYNRANIWRKAAAHEADSGDELLTLDEALERFAERHIEGVFKIGLLLEGGARRSEVQRKLGLSDLEYETAHIWWRDAVEGHVPEA